MMGNKLEWANDASLNLVERLAQKSISDGVEFVYLGDAIGAFDVASVCTSSVIIFARHLADLLGLPEDTLAISIEPENGLITVPYRVSFDSDSTVYFSVLAPLLVEIFEVDLLPCHANLEHFIAKAGMMLGIDVQPENPTTSPSL